MPQIVRGVRDTKLVYAANQVATAYLRVLELLAMDGAKHDEQLVARRCRDRVIDFVDAPCDSTWELVPVQQRKLIIAEAQK